MGWVEILLTLRQLSLDIIFLLLLEYVQCIQMRIVLFIFREKKTVKICNLDPDFKPVYTVCTAVAAALKLRTLLVPFSFVPPLTFVS